MKLPGQMIAKWRKARRRSQEWAAKQASVGRRTLVNWEAGKGLPPRLDQFMAIVDALEIPSGEWLEALGKGPTFAVTPHRFRVSLVGLLRNLRRSIDEGQPDIGCVGMLDGLVGHLAELGAEAHKGAIEGQHAAQNLCDLYSIADGGQ